MIDNLTFFNETWFWPIILTTLIIWIIFIWKEWETPKRSQLLIKIVVGLVALSCLALIALRPAHQIASKSFEVVILTKGFNNITLDSLKKNHKNIKVYDYEINQSIFQNDPTPTSAFVLGHGLASFDLWQLDSLKVQYLGCDVLSGISRLHYNQNEVKGNRSIIKGVYENPKEGHKLILEGPGGLALDSLELISKESQEFQLTTQHKVSGKFLYTLVEKDSSGHIQSRDPLPFNISDQQLLSILIINSFPTFETKYLKNYLSALGHQLVVRSQLTKGRFKYEFFNSNSQAQTSLSRSNLSTYDLIIFDARSVRNLSRLNIADIKASIKEDGLGVYIQPDYGFFSRNNNLVSYSFNSDKLNSSRLNNWPRVSISKQPYSFKEAFLLEPIHRSENIIWSAYYRSGQGKIGSSVFKNTYELLLNGNTEVYEHIWSEILTNISKKEKPEVAWSSSSLMAYQDQPYDFNIRTTLTNPIVRSLQNSQIPLNQNIDISNLWRGVTYPESKGWQTLILSQDSSKTFDFYTTDTTSWKTVNSYKTRLENRRTFNNQLHSNYQSTEQKPIDPIWFYGIFLACIGYLWLEPKL